MLSLSSPIFLHFYPLSYLFAFLYLIFLLPYILLMQEYFSSKSEMTEQYQIKKNYEKYMGKEMER